MRKKTYWNFALTITLIWFCATPAAMAASDWEPLSVHLDCQSRGRTKICPAFLRSFIDESPLLRDSPRSGADVTLRVNATETANTDEVLLSFSSKRKNLISNYDVQTKLEYRKPDEDVRDAIQPTFNRGIAVFLAQRIPESVNVTLSPPKNASIKEIPKSPLGFFIWLGGNGNWSETTKNANSWGGFGFHHITRDSHLGLNIGGNYRLSRRPPITDSLGNKISMNFEGLGVNAKVLGAINLDSHWSTGLYLRAGHEDPEGRYKFTARGHTGISYDLYPADDPRGNRLSVAYLVGYQSDQYNTKNDLGQMKAHFPTHALLSEIAVRQGTQTYRLRASVASQLLDPKTRYVVDVSPAVQFQIGSHVDLSFNFGITQQQVPGPAYIDPQNYELLERSSYSDPLKMHGSLNLHLHFDRTNGERNNRWEVVNRLGELSSL